MSHGSDTPPSGLPLPLSRLLPGPGTFKRLMLSVVVGLVSGLGAVAFFYGLEWTRWFALGYLAGATPPAPAGERLVELAVATPYRPWLLPLIPALGGLLSGILVYAFAPEAEGHGIDAMINAFHNQGGNIRARVPLIKSLASIITLGTGGSAGREGPIAQIGSGFGSFLARVFRLATRERRIYMLAGCAAGLGAIFRAPLGAAITAVEVLYREDFESEAIIPCVISSVVAFSLFTFIFGFDPIFATPRFAFRDPRELLTYGLLGVVCAPVGWAYVKFFYRTRDRFRALTTVPRFLRPVLGGFGVGLVALLVPQAMGGGYGWLQKAILGELGLWLMLLAVVAKILATSLTIGSGGSGGVFGPTLFIGGMLGGVVGQLGHYFFPEVVTQPGGYVLVGMAGFFAGVAKAPLGALLMVSEMTWSYGLLPPLMLVSVIAILFNRGPSLYEKQLKNKFQSPAHEGELTVDVLSTLTVAQVLEPRKAFRVLRAGESFEDLRKVISRTGQGVFPVLDPAGGRLVGLLSLKNVRTVLFEDALRDVVVVGDLATAPACLHRADSLYDALRRFMETGHGQLPVVAGPGDEPPVLGLLDHGDVIRAYHREVGRRRGTQA